MEIVKKQKKGTILRSFVILPFLVVAAGLFFGLIMTYEGDDLEFLLPYYLMVIGCLIVSAGIFFLNIKARKYVWANNIFLLLSIILLFSSIVFAAIYSYFYITYDPASSLQSKDEALFNFLMTLILCLCCGLLFGVLPLIGSIRGRKYTIPLKEARKLERERIENEKIALKKQDNHQVTDDNLESDDISINGNNFAMILDEKVIAKKKKVSFITFIIVCFYYLFLLVIGILGICLPDKGILWSITDPISDVAANYLSGFICLLFLPSFCYYLALRGPFNFSKLVKLILIGLGLLLSIIGIILYLTLLSEYFILTSFTMKLVPILSNLGLIAVYALGCLEINPMMINKKDYRDDKSDNSLKNLSIKLFHSLANIGRAILRVRQKGWFLAVSTVLFTLCIFEMVELLYVLISLVGVLLIVGVIIYLYSLHGPYSSYKTQEFYVNEFGTLHTLHFKESQMFGGDIYIDEKGDRWITEDEGKSFRKDYLGNPTTNKLNGEVKL